MQESARTQLTRPKQRYWLFWHSSFWQSITQLFDVWIQGFCHKTVSLTKKGDEGRKFSYLLYYSLSKFYSPTVISYHIMTKSNQIWWFKLVSDQFFFLNVNIFLKCQILTVDSLNWQCLKNFHNFEKCLILTTVEYLSDFIFF